MGDFSRINGNKDNRVYRSYLDAPNYHIHNFDIDRIDFKKQTGDENDVQPAETVADSSPEHENVNFSDDVSGDLMKFDAIADSSYYDDFLPNTDLSNFLSRPVQISSFTWTQGDTTIVQSTNKPWELFFDNATIKKKIDNYAFLSCNLHIKVVINASPFLYGRILATYRPLAGLFDDTISTTTESSRIPYSQRPHICIRPSESSGGEMVLPFFYHKNWLTVTDKSDFTDMGTISYILYSALQSANGAVGSTVTVTTYAWAENVRVCGPTSKLALQSQDEYGEGIISKPASAIAAAAGLLEQVPTIGVFATATRIGASAVSGIAKLFGFTNVPVISDTEPMKSMVFHSLASTQLSEPVEKLTLDPKNELSIDPRIAGINVNDELNISSLICKDSYLTQFAWDTADTADDMLFNATVLPLMNNYNSSGASSTVDSTPMGHLQYLFWNWRGDIIYTFKFIKSPYHKGRVRISWDPTGDIVSTTDTTTSVFTQIVDIANTDEIEVRVPYLQALPWLKTLQSQELHGGAYDWWHTSSFTYEHDPEISNGTITVRVLNDLSAPVATSSIDVLVHVRAADNFEFANPSDFLPTHSVFEVQSADEHTKVNAGQLGSKDPNRYLVNFGECITSLRTLLRRSSLAYVQTQELNVSTAMSICHAAQTRIPPAWGYDPNGINTADEQVGVGTAPFNFVNRTPYNWLASCFVGRRGSMIWHYNVDSGLYNSSSVRLERLITPITSANFDNVLTQNFVDSTSAEMRFFATFDNSLPRYGTGLGGVSLTDQNTQAGLSVLLPMYNNYRFEFNTPQRNNYGSATDGSDSVTFDLTTTVRRYADIGAANSLVSYKYQSIGTDFTFLFFLNIPTYNVYGNPSTT